MEKTFKTLVSPTTGENYTANSLISKMWERRNFDASIVTKAIDWPAEYNSDWDGVAVAHFEAYESLWTNSINGKINAMIPYHVTGELRPELGYFGMYPQGDVEPPEYHDRELPVIFTGRVDGEEEVLQFDWRDLSEEIKKEILDLVKEALLRAVFRISRPRDEEAIEVI